MRNAIIDSNERLDNNLSPDLIKFYVLSAFIIAEIGQFRMRAFELNHHGREDQAAFYIRKAGPGLSLKMNS
jgi:hypothetical protein